MNNTILKNRWNEVDEELSTFYSKYYRLNKELYSKVQIVFDSLTITNLYEYASVKDIAKLKVRIQEVESKYGLIGYVGYQLRNNKDKVKIKQSDLIRLLILVEYYEYYQKTKEIEKTLFDEVCNIGYKTGQQEVIDVYEKPEETKVISIGNVLLITLLGMTTFNGFKWYDYRDGVIKYNSEQIYKEAINKIREEKKLDVYDDDFQKIFKKQEQSYFYKRGKDLEKKVKKKDFPRLDKIEEDYKSDYKNNYYGNLDNQVAFLVNMSALYGMRKQGVKKVQFIAVIDEKTTDMCQSLDGQIFNIDDWNEFQRYSAEDNKNIVYKVKGLVTGVNLPPINNSFHYCRSTIYPVR